MTMPNDQTPTQEEELARGTPSEGSPLWYEAKIATLTAERDAALAEVKEANEAMVRVGNNAERLRAEVERLKGEAGNKDITIRVFEDELATLLAAQKEAKQQVADLQAELRASNRNWERTCDEAKQAVYQPPTTERDTLRAEVERHMTLARAEAGCPDDDTLVMHCRELRAEVARLTVAEAAREVAVVFYSDLEVKDEEERTAAILTRLRVQWLADSQREKIPNSPLDESTKH